MVRLIGAGPHMNMMNIVIWLAFKRHELTNKIHDRAGIIELEILDWRLGASEIAHIAQRRSCGNSRKH